MTNRRRFTAEFKARVALEALRGDKTIQQIAAKHKVHPNQVSAWKRQAMDGLSAVFSNGAEIRPAWTTTGRSTISTPRSASSRWNAIFWPEGSSDEPGGTQGHDRARPPRSELEPPMPSADDRPLLVLLRAEGREPGEPGTDASDRRAVSQVSVLWQPPDGPSVAARRRPRRSSPGSASHAIDGPTGDLPSAENQRSPPVASGLSLSAQGDGDREAQSGLVRRHHLHPGPARIPVPGRDHGLGNASCARLAAIEHHGCLLLRRGLG